MRRIRHGMWASAAVLALGMCSTAQAQTFTTRWTVVSQQTGEPKGMVLVRVSQLDLRTDDWQPLTEGYTDPNGQFEVRANTFVRYRYTLAVNPAYRTSLVAEERGQFTDPNRTREIVVAVHDDFHHNGALCVDAHAQERGPAHLWVIGQRTSFEMQTDEAGRVVPGVELPNGRYIVYAEREGYLPSFDIVDVAYGKVSMARMSMVPEY